MKKKYLTAPVIAALIGVGLAGVAKAHLNARVNEDGYTFIYSPETQEDYSKSAIETLTNWSYTEDPVTCSGDNKPCSITAPISDVDNPSSNPTLNSGIDIQTDNDLGNVHRVVNVEQNASYSNQD